MHQRATQGTDMLSNLGEQGQPLQKLVRQMDNSQVGAGRRERGRKGRSGGKLGGGGGAQPGRAGTVLGATGVRAADGLRCRLGPARSAGRRTTHQPSRIAICVTRQDNSR